MRTRLVAITFLRRVLSKFWDIGAARKIRPREYNLAGRRFDDYAIERSYDYEIPKRRTRAN
jgi:hypothetical protein